MIQVGCVNATDRVARLQYLPSKKHHPRGPTNIAKPWAEPSLPSFRIQVLGVGSCHMEQVDDHPSATLA